MRMTINDMEILKNQEVIKELSSLVNSDPKSLIPCRAESLAVGNSITLVSTIDHPIGDGYDLVTLIKNDFDSVFICAVDHKSMADWYYCHKCGKVAYSTFYGERNLFICEGCDD